MIVMALAFEVQNRIDDVLQRARAGNRPFFRDVADQEHGHATRLGEQEKLRGYFTNLRDRPRRRFDLGRECRLN